MGSNIVQRLMKPGHECVVSDTHPQAARCGGERQPVISATLSSRFASRGNEEYAAKLLPAMRYEFGGHREKAADKQEAA